jgi:hypothetical protein
MESAIAGSIAGTAEIVQPGQHRQQAVKVFETAQSITSMIGMWEKFCAPSMRLLRGSQRRTPACGHIIRSASTRASTGSRNAGRAKGYGMAKRPQLDANGNDRMALPS